jgi:NAD+ kinase
LATKKKLTNISIILKPSEFDDLPNLVTNLVRWLNKRKRNAIFLDTEFERFNSIIPAKTLKQFSFKDKDFVYNKSDLIITLGGDGTLIGVCRSINPKIPVFGINLGRLGFITEFNKTDFYENLGQILDGKYEIIKKQLYSLKINNRGNVREEGIFFNDAVFNKNDIARMFSLSLEANNEHVYNLTGDGLIISSTVGSTAYSLAAGGPIVHPEVKAFIMTPICPHSLTNRPLVIPDNLDLKIQLLDKVDSVNITLDGQRAIPIKKTDIITIHKITRKNVSLIKNFERTYFQTLKEKLVHGRRDA